MLYIGITTSRSSQLSACVLFISLMHLVNGAQFFKNCFLFVLFASESVTAVFATVIVPFTSM